MSMQNNSKISTERLFEIISQCDPKLIRKKFNSGGKCGNEGLFRFCQYMKPEIAQLEHAIPYIQKWYEEWQNDLVDETGYQLLFDDIEVMAEEIWDKIKFSVGGQLVAAISNAKKRYDETIPELGDYESKETKLLALICFELQKSAKDKEPFYLSSYDAAEAIGLDKLKGQKRALRMLKVFIRKGILTIAKPGNQRKATRYYYVGSPPKKAY